MANPPYIFDAVQAAKSEISIKPFSDDVRIEQVRMEA
jgi:hypothetical protein